MSISVSMLPNRKHPLSSQKELTLLALCVWAEARGEPQEGKDAVAHVVLNRAEKQSWYGKNIRGVILSPKQFSCFNEGDPNREKVLCVQNDEVWADCAMAAWNAYLGFSDDPTGGATHYCRFDVHPSWRSKMEQTKQIGSHIFFKE